MWRKKKERFKKKQPRIGVCPIARKSEKTGSDREKKKRKEKEAYGNGPRVIWASNTR